LKPAEYKPPEKKVISPGMHSRSVAKFDVDVPCGALGQLHREEPNFVCLLVVQPTAIHSNVNCMFDHNIRVHRIGEDAFPIPQQIHTILHRQNSSQEVLLCEKFKNK
jgi:hypothetical protein